MTTPDQAAANIIDTLRLRTFSATVQQHSVQAGYADVIAEVENNVAIQRKVRCGYINTLMAPGTSVIIGYDRDRELAIIAIDFSRQVASGLNPAANNAADRYFHGSTIQDDIQTLSCHPLDAGSMIVVVRKWIYLLNNTWYALKEQQVNLTSYVPSSGNHLLAGLWVTSSNSIEVTISTEQSTRDQLDLTDAQECQNALTTGVYPIKFWRLYAGMTEVKETDSWLDSRQFVNVNGSTGGGSSSAGIRRALVRSMMGL